MVRIKCGAIAFKNGKLISTKQFTPMIDMVGWEDTDNDIDSDAQPIELKGNFYAYIGDKDCTLAFYRERIVVAERLFPDNFFYIHYEYFNITSHHYKWSKWHYPVVAGNRISRVKVTKRNGYYVCKWKYKGSKYKVYFGFGVDIDCYKKYHIVNCCRTPLAIFKKIRSFFLYKLLISKDKR